MSKPKTKYDENRVFVLSNPNAPRLCPELAMEIGLNESILFLQFEFLVAVSNNEHEGRKWTYQSVRDIQMVFPFWSLMTINRTIKSLEEKKLITTGNFNQRKADKTRWFSINMVEASKLKSIHVNGIERIELPVSECDTTPQFDTGSDQFDTPSNQFDTTLPETTTETTTDKEYVADATAPKKNPSKPKNKTVFVHGSLIPLSHPFHNALMQACNVKPSSTDAKKQTVEEAAKDLFADGYTPEQCAQFVTNWWAHKFGQAYFKKAPTPKDFRDHFDEVLNLSSGAQSSKPMTDAELDALAAQYK